MKAYTVLCVVLLAGLAAAAVVDPRCANGGCPTTDPPGPLVRCPDCVNDGCTPNMCNLAMGRPYPGDCSKYCMCEHGGAIEMHCPAGLVFDPEVQVCTWPSQWRCDPFNNNENCNGAPTTTTAAPCTSTTTPCTTTTTPCTTTTTPCTTTTTTPCPTTTTPCTTTTTTPCPTTTTTTCTTTTTTPCPTTTTPCPTTTTPCTTTTEAPCTTQAPCTTEAPRPIEYCPPCVSASCTPHECDFARHLSYPGDCTRFCKCDHGGAIAFDCPDGLVFDPELEVCVWPSSHSCPNAPPSRC